MYRGAQNVSGVDKSALKGRGLRALLKTTILLYFGAFWSTFQGDPLQVSYFFETFSFLFRKTRTRFFDPNRLS